MTGHHTFALLCFAFLRMKGDRNKPSVPVIRSILFRVHIPPHIPPNAEAARNDFNPCRGKGQNYFPALLLCPPSFLPSFSFLLLPSSLGSSHLCTYAYTDYISDQWDGMKQKREAGLGVNRFETLSLRTLILTTKSSTYIHTYRTRVYPLLLT